MKRSTALLILRIVVALLAFVWTLFPRNNNTSLYAQPRPKHTGTALDKVKLQLTWYHKFQFAGYYAAQIKGYYADEGLEVEVRDRNSHKLPVESVLSGAADFGNANSDIVYHDNELEIICNTEQRKHCKRSRCTYEIPA